MRVDWREVAARLDHGVVVLDADARIVTCNPAVGLLERLRAVSGS